MQSHLLQVMQRYSNACDVIAPAGEVVETYYLAQVLRESAGPAPRRDFGRPKNEKVDDPVPGPRRGHAL